MVSLAQSHRRRPNCHAAARSLSRRRALSRRSPGGAISTTAYLLLDVAGKTCALPAAAVREILPLPHLHQPPAAGGPLAGFLNLGGSAVPVLDLARLLGLRDTDAPDPYRHLVLAAEGGLALLVDRVVDLVPVGADSIRPVSDGRTLNGCVETEIVVGDRLAHGLGLSRLLTAEERQRVAALARRAGERLAALDAAVAASGGA